MPDQEPFSHWHLDKRVNIGHLLTTLVLAAGFYSWSTNIEVRQAELNARMDSVEKVQQLQSDSVIRELNQFQKGFESLNRKMDDLVRQIGDKRN